MGRKRARFGLADWSMILFLVVVWGLAIFDFYRTHTVCRVERSDIHRSLVCENDRYTALRLTYDIPGGGRGTASYPLFTLEHMDR